MRRSFVALTAAATLLLTAACGGSSEDEPQSEGTTDVKVGVIPIVDVAPIYLGKEKGFFARRGLNVIMESGQGGAAIVPGW